MKSPRLAGRFKEIVSVLIKYGFKDVVAHLAVPGRERLKRAVGVDPKLTTWERIRMAMEELGPTFIKCGQILSQRADLVPKELITELCKLQDEVPPEKFSDIQKVLDDSFACPVAEIFSKIDEIPIASASLAQVHRAELAGDCREAALKIQRPGIADIIEKDMDILEKIAVRLDARISYLKVYNLPQVVHRIRKLMMQEIDFLHEMHNMQAARSQFQPEDGIIIPDVYPELCRKHVLTMAMMHGEKLKNVNVEILRNRKDLARRGLNFSLQQILVHGFFHADPHPSNVLVDGSENLIIVDWGMTGWVTPRVQFELINLFSALANNEIDEIVDFLMTFTSGREDVDRLELQNEIMEVTTRFVNMPLKDVNLGQMLLEVTSILRSYGRVLGTDLSIMIKALITAEQTAKMIDPDLNVIQEAEPIVSRLIRERFEPARLYNGLYRYLRLLMRHQYDLPRHAVSIVGKLDDGKIAIRFRHENLEGLQTTMEGTVNRLVLGIITGALFLGSSMIILSGTGPTLWGYPALGVIGYLIALVIVLRLTIVMIRTNKGRQW
jgi:ubiquinone biosynthesis protein